MKDKDKKISRTGRLRYCGIPRASLWESFPASTRANGFMAKSQIFVRFRLLVVLLNFTLLQANVVRQQVTWCKQFNVKISLLGGNDDVSLVTQ